MSFRQDFRYNAQLLLALGMLVVACVYWSGLSGGWLFDDYPNIVDNHSVQPVNASLPSLVGAALSSPASEFKRPLASLSFAANYLADGLNPYGWKLVNLLIHLLNGLGVFLLARALLRSGPPAANQAIAASSGSTTSLSGTPSTQASRVPAEVIAAWVAIGWMLLPINLTAVLYVVQRMESMANLFVLIGLLGYVAGRCRMLDPPIPAESAPSPASRGGLGRGRSSQATRGFILCAISITIPTVLGLLAKETAVMLPLYALLIEWAMFQFRTRRATLDLRLLLLFVVVLVLPLIIGMVLILPGLLKPGAWAIRDFTLGTRLLSEARIVLGYVRWTFFPTPHALSFYHDDFRISTGLLSPWTTLASIAALAVMLASAFWLRSRRPLVALGIVLFLGCHLLTGTVLPLELVYEHRNYFSSFGLLLAAVPLLAVARHEALALPRYLLLGGLLLCWTAITAMTSYAWGSPLRLAQDLADRAPRSPRAQYELGRTYIIYSHYDPASPFTALAYAPLEKSAALPDSSILPEQALIFMNARMHLPLKGAWWDSMITKLKMRPPGIQDDSSLGALTQCTRDQECDLPTTRMVDAYRAALSHPRPSARLLATYGDYAWNVLLDHALGMRMTDAAVIASPGEAAYRITQIRMLIALGQRDQAMAALQKLKPLNIGGRLNNDLISLQRTLAAAGSESISGH